jgi:hypothetical protein
MSRKMQMTATISGTRGNGQPWPPAGHPLTVADWEADQLIAGDLARPWPADPEADPVPAAQPEQQAQQDYFRPIGSPDPVSEPAPEPEPEPDQADAPKPVQPKADWVAWAVAHGASEQEANEATKAQLMEQYGDRA